LIRAGRVALNGRLCRNPETPVRCGADRIEIDGSLVRAQAKIYLILNKPRGVVTTASDEKGRNTVYALLPEDQPWVVPVGRLDKASEGLLLLTNDTEWSARVQAPETHLDKTYHVQIGIVADGKLARRLQEGLRTNAGERLRVKHACVLRTGEKNTWLTIVLDEGRNRHIRRLFEVLGIEVLRLVRVAIGPLHLGQLTKGSSRCLTTSEKMMLDDAMRKRQKA
jgi:23S rRNA pseudouridine2605 synthase